MNNLDASCERRIRKKNYMHGAIFSDLRNLTACVAQKTFLKLTFSISGIFVLHVNVNSKVEPLLTQKTWNQEFYKCLHPVLNGTALVLLTHFLVLKVSGNGIVPVFIRYKSYWFWSEKSEGKEFMPLLFALSPLFIWWSCPRHSLVGRAIHGFWQMLKAARTSLSQSGHLATKGSQASFSVMNSLVVHEKIGLES